MIISIDEGKAFESIQHGLMKNVLVNVQIEKKIPQRTKGILRNAANIILNKEKLEEIQLKSEMRHNVCYTHYL